MTREATYRVYTIVILILFLLPAIQRNWPLLDLAPLGGASGSHPKQDITLSDWLDGTYQTKTDKYCTDSFGLRSPMVRFVNQLDYSLFGKANAHYVVIGKNNCLYETPYVETYLGMDFSSDTEISGNVRKLNMVRDTLQKLGVELQVIFAPGKGSYFPEFIPDYYWQYKSDSTHYDRLRYHMDRCDFPYIDLHAWFRSMKDTTSYPLFPLTGIHWSKYGMIIATDSILKAWGHIESAELPRLVYSYGHESTTTEGSDSDVEDGLNLMQSLPHFKMMYPNYHFEDSAKEKIRTAVIADSYFWGLFDIGLSTIACDSGEFWYYFKQVYPQYFSTQLTVEQMDLKKAIESKDIIAILQTDATLDRFGFGFIDAAYDLYYPEQRITHFSQRAPVP